jgi:hypothetical protein
LRVVEHDAAQVGSQAVVELAPKFIFAKPMTFMKSVEIEPEPTG